MTVILGYTRCEAVGCTRYATHTICLFPAEIKHYCPTHARQGNYGRGIR